MIEPFYVRQTAEQSALDDPQKWARQCIDEAKSAGGKSCRLSISEDKTMLLFEAWDKMLHEVEAAGGQGDQRWMLQRKS